MARQSFFQEKRGQNNDPNFFNRVPIEEIRKSVKRIIKDIKYDLISEQDYVYFKNSQILQACIYEAQEQYNHAMIIRNSLNFYINEFLNKGYRQYPSTNIVNERTIAGNEQIIQNTRAMIWYNIMQMFMAINDGADPIMVLSNIKMINGKDINLL